MSNKKDEIQTIVAQLLRLQIDETELLRRLEELNEIEERTSGSSNVARAFAVGDLVRIKNPRYLQADRGKIVLINTKTNRISVRPKKGIDISRIPANLSHID
jgi:hypothetical protein